jgi:hypothetical protein
MNLEQTIVSSILNYPLLYKDINYKYSKEKVLVHLFFVNGNGYEWIQGELIAENSTKQEHEKIPDNYFKIPVMSSEKDESTFTKKWRLEEGKPYVAYEIKSSHALSVYPLCDYAKLLNLPEDIKADWLVGAKEALLIGLKYWNDPYKHLEDTYIRDYARTRKLSKIIKYVKEQLDYLKSIENKLKQLEEK